MDFFNEPDPNEAPQEALPEENTPFHIPDDLNAPVQPEPVPEVMEPLFASEQPPLPPVTEPPVYHEPPRKKKPKRSGRGTGRRIFATAAALVLLVGCCFATGWIVNARWEARAEQLQQDFSNQLDAISSRFTNKLDALQEQVSTGSGTIITGNSSTVVNVDHAPGRVYADNVAGVVQITCQITTSYYGQTSTGTATGSGFILTENGYVVTNYHVVEGASSVTFTTFDGQTHDAAVIGYDESNDVALLKADVTGLQPVKLGSSATLGVGEQVVAIGFPLSAQDATLTVGYVSAKNRDVNTSGIAINMIQTDAAINSGNSGGPLFNMSGEVIGITTAKYSGTTSSGASIEGIGFAIPIDDVASILSDLMTYGYINSAYLGVYVRDMTEIEQAAAELYSFPVGVYVEDVTPGYCAEKAGLLPKDIIIALGGYEITDMTVLTRTLRKFVGGDQTTITVFRSGKELVLNITLDNKPAQTQTPVIP